MASKRRVRSRIASVLRPFIGDRIVSKVRRRFAIKYDSEMGFWRDRFEQEGRRFENKHYEKHFVSMAEEASADFVRGKIIADFGCGPRGSLVWAEGAAMRIGIDVLADRFADAFAEDLVRHGMVYLKSTESVIPLPTGFVDIMFTLNAIDHVDNFPQMCREMIRVVKPGGTLIGGFNLGEPPTVCEPQSLSEPVIQEHLLAGLNVQSYRVTGQPDNLPPGKKSFEPFYSGNLLPLPPTGVGLLWVRATKPADERGTGDPRGLSL